MKSMRVRKAILGEVARSLKSISGTSVGAHADDASWTSLHSRSGPMPHAVIGFPAIEHSVRMRGSGIRRKRITDFHRPIAKGDRTCRGFTAVVSKYTPSSQGKRSPA